MTYRAKGSPPGVFGAFGAIGAIAIAVTMLLSAYWLSFDSASSENRSTRSGPFFTAAVDGDGAEGDICLAGYRFYRFTYEFADSQRSGLRYINFSKMNTDPPIISSPAISYCVTNDTAFLVGDLALSVREPEMVSNATHVISFGIDVMFHLSWSEETSITLTPSYMDYGSMREDLQDADIHPIEIWGMMDKPKMENITDERGNVISDGDIIRSNSTIRIGGVSFSYWHSKESFSDLSPMRSELSPLISDGIHDFAPASGSVFNFSITTPDLPDSKWEITMVIENVFQNDWAKRVALWSLTLQLDGYGPTFELKTPQGKVGEGFVNWTITVSEKPSSTLNLVNGSSLMVRMRGEDGVWTEWISTGEETVGRTVTMEGASELGLNGNNQIQFKAKDVLGNSAESGPFQIDLNHPPVLSVPAEHRNRTYLTNQSIDMDGYDFATDEDDSRESLIYNWKFDGEVIGKTNEFSKPLFVEAQGEHSITLTVTDGYGGSDTVTFTVVVKKAPEPPQDPAWKRLLKDPVFQVVASSILAIVVIILISVLIIVVVRRLGRSEDDGDDFVISEDANRNNEDIARKLQEMYGGGYAAVGPDGSANAYEDMTGEEFDFDYNLYEILGLENDASDEEIKRAYRKLAGYYHPDKVSHHKEVDDHEAREVMVKVNKAKEFLMNPERKARYDEHLSELDFSIET